jgi:hypothetical protein
MNNDMQLAMNMTANATAAKALTGKADAAKKIGLFVAILLCIVAAIVL